MSRDQEHNANPIDSLDDLRAFFASGCKTSGPLGVGTEHEKFGYRKGTDEAIAYEGDDGIGALLTTLAERYGWNPLLDDGKVMALERDGGAVTLEPGGQLELSGRITATIAETDAELRSHIDEVAAVGAELGQQWCAYGMRPLAQLDEVPWMPKSRYQVMRRYLPTRGSMAHWMMKMTCTVQANFDYRTEADALEIIRLGTLLAPISTAMFAASPMRAGADNGLVSERMEIWEDTDNDRCGTVPFFLDPSATFSDWVEWILDVPMFFIRRGERYVDMTSYTFRRFMSDGYEGEPASIGDFELHVSSVFPTVRMKNYIEMRSADCGPPEYILAYAALWRGVVYDSEARAAAMDLFGQQNVEHHNQLGHVCRHEGLAGVWQGKTLRTYADEFVRIAASGLDRLDAAAGVTTQDSAYLAALRNAEGVVTAPAEKMRSIWQQTADPAALRDAFDIRNW